MAALVRMPEVLTGVTEAAIQTWLIEEGAEVVVGTPLAEVETDKAVVEYASEVEGTVLKILVAAGDQVAIGAPIVVIGAPGEPVDEAIADDSAPQPARADASAPSASASGAGTTAAPESSAPETPAPAAAVPESSAPQDPTGSGEARSTRLFASPLVRRLARERGIDLATVRGSGPQGRVVRRDLDQLPAQAAPQPAAGPARPEPTSAAAPAAGFEEIPLTGMRRAIARRLTESKSTVPHFYVEAECRVDRLLQLRREVNETAGVRVSVNDFVLKAVALALRDVPQANSTWGETVIRRHHSVDIAVAVAIDGGLVTPVIRDVDRLTLGEISAAVGDLAERARAGRLKQHELEGGSFSVSNLGMYGVSSFSAIINPPHAGILAVSAARQVPVVDDGELAVGTVMKVTLSADHRVVDGAVGAEWLAAFVRRIENPLGMLV
jgi:pyruvate dehydrogenase E2 component (dihydrolipoamide acetyltransferase)